ncbi:MAG: phytase, partial [Lentisphaeria bacterium]|nr:phytase [Lentisphaeria bacterium]NQZ69604.1 phytase [Lentisphaeria bacterium]
YQLREFKGIDISYGKEGGGYLVISSYGNSSFGVIDKKTYKFIGKFKIKGARRSLGLAITNRNLGPQYKQGVFACHTLIKGKGNILISRWGQILNLILPESVTPGSP